MKVVLILICLALPVFAQDTVKISASFANSEFGNILNTQYNQGISAELDAKIYKKDRFRLGGVFQYHRAALDTDNGPDTYSFGPQLSGDLFNGHVSPFGRALFGFRTTYNNDRVFSRTYGVGVDINLGHIFIRPFALDYQKIEGCNAPVQRYTVGGGVRF